MSELITRKLVNLRPEKFEILDIELPTNCMINQTKIIKTKSTSKNVDKNSKEQKTNSKLLQTGPKQKFSTFKYTDNSESEISEDLSQKFLQNDCQINKLHAFNNMKINGSKNKTIVPIILLRNSNVVNSNLSATDWFFRQIEHFIRQTNNDLDNDDDNDNDNDGQKLMTELLPICILIRNQKSNNNNALLKYKQESLDEEDEEKTLLKIRPFVTAQIQPVGTVMDVLTGTVDVIAFHQDRSGFWYRDF